MRVSSQRLTSFSLVLGALGLVACGGHRVSLTNPAVAGAIEEAVVVRNDFFGENQLNLSRHSLDDEVRIVRFAQDSVCFHAIMRSLETERNVPRLDTPNGEIGLEVNGTHLPIAGILAAPVEQSTVTGTEYVAQGTGQYETVCTETSSNGNCMRYEEQEITTSVAVAVDHAIDIQSSILCFTNDGSITPHTSSLELHLGRAHFGFDLHDAAPEGAAWPSPTPIVAAGYEELVGSASATSGSEAPAPAPAAPTIPSDLAAIPVRTLRIVEGRDAIIEVDANGAIAVQGRTVGHIDGMIRDVNGNGLVALGNDGSVYALTPDRSHFELAAHIDGEGRLTTSDGSQLWIDRRGAAWESTPGNRPRRATAAVEGRRLTTDDRALGAILMLMAHDTLTWR